MACVCSTVLVVGLALPGHSAAQEHSAPHLLDRRLIGTWIRRGSGSSLEIRPDLQTVYLNFTGQPEVSSGRGSIRPCAKSGGNVCIEKERFNCTFRYSFSGGELNLQYMEGRTTTACKAATGDYRKED